jgi:hypothetical protein
MTILLRVRLRKSVGSGYSAALVLNTQIDTGIFAAPGQFMTYPQRRDTLSLK